ncbi:DUF427 domain-containing protein [Paenibacillus validus]|uniref:DUF427 domain-containing protein n=1 Tax=Paenibacillus validus TaxID=44253 RepID=A0A7X2Z7L0_9BACL|nr:DUF427 domain-containing protein [Paenibacillus validus]
MGSRPCCEETIADSKGVLTLHERGHLPVYYFPESDVRKDLLMPSLHTTHCPLKGDASYWNIQAGDRVIDNTVWSYQQPRPESEAIRGYLAFYWNKVDTWLEEEEEVFVHPRDPYKRVDAVSSSRHIQIVLNDKRLKRDRSKRWLRPPNTYRGRWGSYKNKTRHMSVSSDYRESLDSLFLTLYLFEHGII